jgi:ATP diphosphatase
MNDTPEQDLSALRELLQIMRQLRDPQQGCTWDRAQDERSLARYTLEEAYELGDALERGDARSRRDELGDVLFQVVFLAQLGAERGEYDFNAVARGIADKLLRRHPHVFDVARGSAAHGSTAHGSGAAHGSATHDSTAARSTWEAIKASERAARGEPGLLADIPLAAPALSRAAKVGKRAAQVGFDWDDASGASAKVAEELAEVMEAERTGDAAHCEEELGDLLLAVTSLARHLKVDPETALRRAVAKFERRFTAMEALARAAHGSEQGRDLHGRSAQELDDLWQQAKRK